MAPDDPAPLDGPIELLGRLPYSSNGTWLVEVGPHRTRAVYKPRSGEAPLADFPPGLHRRECAVHLLATALGWPLVPETVRRDGPLGDGSVQRFVDHDPERHYFVLHDQGRHHDQLRRLCVFDLVANSTDRKSGHVLVDADDHVWAIDNGLALHAQFKLRTVIWDYAGEPVPDDLRADVARFAEGPLPDGLADLLDPFERDALLGRARAVAELERLPHDPTGRRVPWPLV